MKLHILFKGEIRDHDFHTWTNPCASHTSLTYMRGNRELLLRFFMMNMTIHKLSELVK
ncbi:hypothetical protein ABEW60_02625 [Paenibacillus jamilae]|uniref:hypothetical protein n=1 Tax=Paenibacillus jamilae TaxID=114136 RepID=UPI003D2A05B9|nr:hypothetical protein [Paenibacillus sp. A3M_27_13]